AVAILDPGIAFLERPVGMGEHGDPPQCLQPIICPAMRRDEQPRAQRSGGVTELAPGPVQPAPKRAGQPIGQLVEPLALRREQAVSVGPATKRDLELLAGPVERAARAALGTQAEL